MKAAAGVARVGITAMITVAAGLIVATDVPASASSTAHATASFEPATCTVPVTNIVSCVLPDVEQLPVFNLATLLTEAQAQDSSISSSTPMVITAFGGAGHKGYSAAAGNPGGGGGQRARRK